MDKNQLAQQLRAELSPTGGKALSDLLDLMVSGHHKSLETARGDDVIFLQGAIESCRLLKKNIFKQKKS
jgi:hypothetical protein